MSQGEAGPVANRQAKTAGRTPELAGDQGLTLVEPGNPYWQVQQQVAHRLAIHPAIHQLRADFRKIDGAQQGTRENICDNFAARFRPEQSQEC